MKQIYILLSKTETIPSQWIYKMTRGKYTHTSLSLTPQTDGFYSYARRKPNNPLFAGLIRENIHSNTFARYPNCHCTLLQISVSEEGYDRIRRAVDHYWEHYEEATYNFLGLLPLRMGISIPRKYKLTCSQFVALMLAASGEIQLPKKPYIMLPSDFLKISNIEKIYDGVLNQCNFNRATKCTPVVS